MDAAGLELSGNPALRQQGQRASEGLVEFGTEDTGFIPFRFGTKFAPSHPRNMVSLWLLGQHQGRASTEISSSTSLTERSQDILKRVC
ncbi:hypothetical protein PoB_003856300 [Plakobranchus ocellatus]|uniref:Uncharacterized protein n=1 Tax=Plakobranchus ocellatus TaxID=259542 RepID=A0AAV4AZX4_9GAST|nr:hypothetical protein PoB_003856300 [Plakobranchus ocellatus]